MESKFEIDMKRVIIMILVALFSISATNAQTSGNKRTQKTTTATRPNKPKPQPTPSPNPKPSSISKSKQITTPSPTPPKRGYINGHEWVDLGLSVKWATCNVGASSPSDYGDYFAQGEINSKTIYNDATYTPPYDSNVGFIDRFDASHDAATVNWGASWRMPTDAENKELCTKCKWTWTAINGHNGYRITGPSGKSIFMPASGIRGEDLRIDDGKVGYYWSSLWGWSSKKNNYSGRTLQFDNDSYSTDNARSWAGLNIRPVTK